MVDRLELRRRLGLLIVGAAAPAVELILDAVHAGDRELKERLRRTERRLDEVEARLGEWSAGGSSAEARRA